jgi:hypothetical protein
VSATYTGAEPAGWTVRLEYSTFASITNGYIIPPRDNATLGSGADNFANTNGDYGQALSELRRGGFLTTPISSGTTTGGEEYLYVIEITPTPTIVGTNPRMSPIVDDVQVVYMTQGGTVLEEVELVD